MPIRERIRGSLTAAGTRLRKASQGLRTVAASPRWRRAGVSVLALAATGAFLRSGIAQVREGEVGVLVNNLTGTISVEERVGYRVIVPGVHGFHRLDRRVQSLAMAERPAGGFGGGEAVKIKTSDGSNVSLDLHVNYRLLAERAAEILRNAGPGGAVSAIWVRSATRAMVAREFGALTTEQIYDATRRDERARAVVAALNEQLADVGIEVISVVPQDLRFYKEYEEIIKAKKLADQEVEERKSQANLAQEESRKEVAAAEFAARAKLTTTDGEAERTRAEADGYLRRVRLEAEGALISDEGRAEGVLATGLADAEGLKEATAALAGPGGVNLVALEYARKLGQISFSGVPVLDEGRVGQYRVHAPPAAVTAGAAR